MQIHVVDLQDFDQVIETDPDIIIADLLKQINEKYKYDTSSCSIYHFGQQLELGFHLTPEFLNDDNVLVLLNHLIVKEKSYPKVNNAYRFQTSRFKNYFIELKNTGQLCPKLDTIRMNILNTDKNSFENSIYNNFQIQLNPDLAILPSSQSTKSDTHGAYEFYRNSQAFDPEALDRFTPEQVESLYRLLETGHNPNLILHTFGLANYDEERTLMILNSAGIINPGPF